MEDDLNFSLSENNLNIFENGRRPQVFSSSKEDNLNIFLMEDDLKKSNATKNN